MRINLPVIEIIQKYKDGQSETALAKEYGVERRTIHRRLLSNNIDIRSAGKTSKLRKNADFHSSENLNQIIDGILLGDGWIEREKNSDNARLAIEQRKDRLEWLNIIKAELEGCNVYVAINYREPRTKTILGIETTSKGSFFLRTGRYGNFSQQRIRWYPDRKKIIPPDISLTPLTLAHWFCGDGCGGKYEIVFYTNNFAHDDVYFLSEKLKDVYGWDCRVYLNRGKPTLRILKKKYRNEFVDVIRKHLPKCFEYKIREYNE